MNLPWQIFHAIGPIFIFLNGQILKKQLFPLVTLNSKPQLSLCIGKLESGSHVGRHVVARLWVDGAVVVVRRRNRHVVRFARNVAADVATALVELEDLARVRQVDHGRIEMLEKVEKKPRKTLVNVSFSVTRNAEISPPWQKF